MKAPPTPPGFLLDFAAQARNRLSYVYTGNIPGEKSDTSCPYCRKTIISRRGFRTDTSALALKEDAGKLSYFCVHCGEKAPVSYAKLT
jgi:pyruvate formate lyase activating enzyme